MSVPSWLSGSIFYQIFPDRFFNGDLNNDPPNKQSWEASPTINGFKGGDLPGIRKKLDYLQDLGITALYLNPIFLSPSTHRYNTTDYYTIDPHLGTQQDFNDLVHDLHQRGMRLMLDGVFNHCARSFFAFADVLENENESPYCDWFHIREFPLHAYSPGQARNYEAWWGFKSLPKFNTRNPAVRKYLLEIGRYWVEQGIDAWRLDVPNEIDDDAFWAEFRRVVHQANPDTYLVGEIWDVDARWANDSHFDGLMNYPLRKAIVSFTQHETNASQFQAELQRLLGVYPRENIYAMYNLLSSHDIERILTVCSGSPQAVQFAYSLLFGLPGIPAIYYGDEVGVAGGKDPDCRRAFPWDEVDWDSSLRALLQRLITVRKSSPALQDGDWKILWTSDERQIFTFERQKAGQTVLVLANAGESEQVLDFSLLYQAPNGHKPLVDLLTGQPLALPPGQPLQITLPPRTCRFIDHS